MTPQTLPTVAARPAEPPRRGRPASRRGRVGRAFARLALLAAVTVGLLVGGLSVWRARAFSEHLALARADSLHGRTIAATSHLQLCESIDADDRGVMLLAARVLRMSQRWLPAEEVLERYWATHGDDEALAFERLLLKAARDDTAAADAPLLARVARGGDDARLARQALVSGYLREFRYAQSQAALDGWLAEVPGDPLAELLLGRYQEHISKYRDASESYAAVVARDPTHCEARLRLALTLMQQRRAEEALDHLGLLRGELPGNPEVAVQWAVALRQVGRTDEAVAALEQSLAEFPDSASALAERATVALNAGDDALAADLFGRALPIDPGAIGARSQYVVALMRLGRAADADRERDRVKVLTADTDRLTELIHGPLQADPRDPGPPFEIAGIALRAGQPLEALRWFHAALQRDPGHGPTHAALAVTYREMGNPVLATRHRALAAKAARHP